MKTFLKYQKLLKKSEKTNYFILMLNSSKISKEEQPNFISNLNLWFIIYMISQ